MSELTHFEQRLSGLIEKLSPANRRQLATKIAKELRVNQQQRIKRQQAPDGTPYVARKAQSIRGKKGRVKRAMFTKLRTNRYMAAKGTQDAATVAFVGQVQRMARVHQYGLKDRPSRRSQWMQYYIRPLLGFSTADHQVVEDVIFSYVSQSTLF
ncbi:phage virion morphogenesis protein [Yersinia alsatica]|uniref:phage virion morphogenesis protein n=1 Tax=Yersinia alsatica TaxID=2890317 RepID=UPI0011A0F163|nr:phage virion morphogenesis protein [Yersinia alsatica]